MSQSAKSQTYSSSRKELVRGLRIQGTILVIVGTFLFLLGGINGGIVILSVFGRWNDQTFSVPDEYRNYSQNDAKEELVANGFDQNWIDNYSGSLDEFIMIGEVNEKNIVVETIKTLGGHWNADQAIFTLAYSEDETDDEQKVLEVIMSLSCEPRYDSWDLGISGTDQTVNIHCEVEIPADASWLHKELYGQVKMNVTYPVFVDANAYQDRSRVMNKSVTYYSISESDHTLLKVYQPPGYDRIDITIIVLSKLAGSFLFILGFINATLAIGSHVNERFYIFTQKLLALLKK